MKLVLGIDWAGKGVKLDEEARMTSSLGDGLSEISGPTAVTRHVAAPR